MPRTASVRPVRRASASSLHSPPATAQWMSVIALMPALARPGASQGWHGRHRACQPQMLGKSGRRHHPRVGHQIQLRRATVRQTGSTPACRIARTRRGGCESTHASGPETGDGRPGPPAYLLFLDDVLVTSPRHSLGWISTMHAIGSWYVWQGQPWSDDNDGETQPRGIRTP
jgi:hypothetical protein